MTVSLGTGVVAPVAGVRPVVVHHLEVLPQVTLVRRLEGTVLALQVPYPEVVARGGPRLTQNSLPSFLEAHLSNQLPELQKFKE